MPSDILGGALKALAFIVTAIVAWIPALAYTTGDVGFEFAALMGLAFVIMLTGMIYGEVTQLDE